MEKQDLINAISQDIIFTLTSNTNCVFYICQLIKRGNGNCNHCPIKKVCNEDYSKDSKFGHCKKLLTEAEKLNLL